MRISINELLSAATLCVVVGIYASPAWCEEGVFPGKTVAYLGGGDTRPCAFFTLDGVAEALPAVPGAPWFVLPKTHSQYKETFAVLLSAKLTGRQVYVITTGNVHPCGHAEVLSVVLMP